MPRADSRVCPGCGGINQVMKVLQSYRVQPNDDERRLDRVIRKLFPGLALSLIYKFLRRGDIRLNARKTSPQTRVREGDTIEIYRLLGPRQGQVQHESANALPADRIIYEDDNILAVNKEAGIVVHGPDSLEEQVSVYLMGKVEKSLSFKPGPLHRLDQNTSGLILFSKSLAGARLFSAWFHEGAIGKYYVTIVDGHLDQRLRLKDRLTRDTQQRKTFAAESAGRLSETTLIPVCALKKLSLVVCRIASGITHQIRAQAAAAGHPLCGDIKYGGSGILSRFFLHAAALVIHQGGYTYFRAPLPEEGQQRLLTLFGVESIGRLEEFLLNVLKPVDK